METNVKKIKVLVMVLNFNKALRVLEGVRDLYSQKIDFDLSVVVGDNSCNENERTLLESLGQYPGIKLMFFEKNLGYIKAHNVMSENFDADYYVTYNPDILIKDSNVLSELINYMENNKDVGVIAPKQINDDGKIAMTVRGWPNLILQFARRTFLRNLPVLKQLVARDEMQYLDYSKVQEVPWLQASFNCVRGSLWKEVGGHDERYFLFMSDPEICWQSWKQGLKVIYYPKVTVYADGIRVSAGGIKTFFKSWVLRQHLKDSWEFFKKHLFEKKPF